MTESVLRGVPPSETNLHDLGHGIPPG